MSDAPEMPETIWAWFFVPEKQDDVMKGGWNDEPHRCEFEFTRTDRIADALIEAERRGMMRAQKIAQEIADENAKDDWSDMSKGAMECVSAIRQAATELEKT